MGVPLQPDWVKLELPAQQCYETAAIAVELEILELNITVLSYYCKNIYDCTEFLTSFLSSVNKLSDSLLKTLKKLCASEVSTKWVSEPIDDIAKPFSYSYKVLTRIGRKC